MDEIYINGNNAFLEGGRAIVNMNTDIGFIEDIRNINYTKVNPAKGSCTTKEVEFVPFGRDNNLPLKIMEKSGMCTIVGSNIEFNAKLAYGDGLTMFRRVKDEGGNVKIVEVMPDELPDVEEFLKNSNYMRVMQETSVDLVVFSDAFISLNFGKRLKGDKPKIVQIKHKEMCFSRVSKQDETTRKIMYHGYSSQWGIKTMPEDCIVSSLLDRSNPLYDLKIRTGMIPDPENGKTKDEGQNRYVVSLNLPIPGRFYYNKPYWWSIFIDWYDFCLAIPKFKKALLQNQMVLKYVVTINENFWDKLYDSLNCNGDAKKETEAKRDFLQKLNDYLSGAENAGKSFVSHFHYDQINHYEEKDVIITPLESFIKGGEYIEDSEEATNVICNTMLVHPSLKGASPGATKTINGTEARELFIIAQSLFKSLRDMMVLPLYLAKEINGWPKWLEFGIKNTMLTTLDEGTGSIKSIGNQEM